jgi:RES domain-containing protein
MIVWRLARAVYPALDGEGARRHGGRWNEPGTPVVYTSEHLSLAVLESLVHADPDLLPDDLTAFQIEVPDEIAGPAFAAFEESPPPDTWVDPDVAVELGQAWVASGGPVLVVPSVVVPRERNVLLNPRHDRAVEIRIVGDEPFAFDARLFGG